MSDFKNNNEVVEFVIEKYLGLEGEPELRHEFVKKMKRIQKQKNIRVNNFAKRYGSNCVP